MDPDHLGLRLLLPDHHRRLDARCRALLASLDLGTPDERTGRWRDLETELNEHMAAEEILVLPSYAVFAPDDARRIAAEHAQLRALVGSLGAERAERDRGAAQLRELVDLLEAHAQHEDDAMYPWAQANLLPMTEEVLFTRICRWFGITRSAPPALIAAH